MVIVMQLIKIGFYLCLLCLSSVFGGGAYCAQKARAYDASRGLPPPGTGLIPRWLGGPVGLRQHYGGDRAHYTQNEPESSTFDYNGRSMAGLGITWHEGISDLRPRVPVPTADFMQPLKALNLFQPSNRRFSSALEETSSPSVIRGRPYERRLAFVSPNQNLNPKIHGGSRMFIQQGRPSFPGGAVSHGGGIVHGGHFPLHRPSPGHGPSPKFSMQKDAGSTYSSPASLYQNVGNWGQITRAG